MTLRPDVWYNSVDGIRLGGNIEGRVSGTHEEGPHRLDLGLWVGTRFPVNPFSYYLSFTEPISAFSEYGSEANVRFVSSIREGYHQHQLVFNKRWQESSDYRNYWELGMGYSVEKRFKDSYLEFPELWDTAWKGLIKFNVSHQSHNRLGKFQMAIQSDINTYRKIFARGNVTLIQEIPLADQVNIHLRGFAGATGINAYQEYAFMKSSPSPIYWLDQPLTRSKGTLPGRWLRSGNLNLAGGPGLRGYTRQEYRSLDMSTLTLYRSVSAVNVEIDFPNPVESLIRRSHLIAEFLSFRSYFFSDSGFPLKIQSKSYFEKIYSDAGVGVALSLHIPDYLNKPRGFVLRYEIPFWLSDVENGEEPFKVRHILGVGAVITL
ncbi:MAG: hypothetical protein WD599_05550 [Balneolaceae bacterium]